MWYFKYALSKIGRHFSLGGWCLPEGSILLTMTMSFWLNSKIMCSIDSGISSVPLEMLLTETTTHCLQSEKVSWRVMVQDKWSITVRVTVCIPCEWDGWVRRGCEWPEVLIYCVVTASWYSVYPPQTHISLVNSNNILL